MLKGLFSRAERHPKINLQSTKRYGDIAYAIQKLFMYAGNGIPDHPCPKTKQHLWGLRGWLGDQSDVVVSWSPYRIPFGVLIPPISDGDDELLKMVAWLLKYLFGW